MIIKLGENNESINILNIMQNLKINCLNSIPIVIIIIIKDENKCW